MGFGSALWKKRKMRKLIESYVGLRKKEKMAFNKQIRAIDNQFKNKQIEEQTYQRLRVILETQYYQKQQEEWLKIQTKFYNPLNP